MLAADGGEPEKVTDLPLGAGAPVWSPNGERIAFSAAVDPAAGNKRKRPLVTRTVDYQADGAGLFGAIRNQLHVVDLATGECRQLTDGEHAGQPAWSPDGHTLAFTRKVGPDSDLTFETAVHLLDVDDPKAKPRAVALEGGIAAAVSFTADGESLLVVGHPSLALGHAHLLRVPLDGGAPVDLTGHLDRNVMPGGPAYPGALPVETADGRLLFASATAAARTCGTTTRSGPRRRRPRRLGALGRRRHRRGRARHPDVVRRDRRARPRVRRRDRAHRPRRQPRRRRRCSSARSAPSPSPTAPRSRPGWSATPSARARGRCCSTSTAARTTRGTPRPTRCTSTTRSSSPGAGRSCWSTRAAATATARRSTTASTARGASPTPTTSSSRSTSSSPRASPTPTGSRSPATATAAS